MRELLIGQTEQYTPSGGRLTYLYHILVRDTSPPICCESYGVRVTNRESGEQEEVLDITVFYDRIQDLTERLLQGGVTPCTLRDVVNDWL